MLIAKVSQPIPGGKRELVEVESEKGVEGGGRPKVIKKERGRRKKEQGDFFTFLRSSPLAQTFHIFLTAGGPPLNISLADGEGLARLDTDSGHPFVLAMSVQQRSSSILTLSLTAGLLL